LIAAITYRNVPETPVPIQSVRLCSVEPEFFTWPPSTLEPSESRNASRNTTVEWPSENQKPTLSGRSPSAIS
jgi:hypothetical protein